VGIDMSMTHARRDPFPSARQWALTRLASISAEAGDVILYLMGAVFALVIVLTSAVGLYAQWGRLALGPFAFGVMASSVLAVNARRIPTASPDASAATRRIRRGWMGRIVVALFVFIGATAIPLGFEVLWRSDNDPGTHQQPEVITVEHGGQEIARGQDPYHLVVNQHRVVPYHAPGQPNYQGFLPYLPLMAIFGIPSERWHDVGLTDARIFFALATLLVTALALGLCRADRMRKMRALQVLVILPIAALPLATGGDDMPVTALLLLGMVLTQRRQPLASGVALGIASAMKFTAWPLAALALFAARNRRGERRPASMLLGMLMVAGPSVLPFVLRSPRAIFEDVILFPLGLSGLHTTAASALPGHLLVNAFPVLDRSLPLAVGLVGGVLLTWHLCRRTPETVSQVCATTGVLMAVLTLLAPDPRVGFLLYPINFFVWSYLFSEPRGVGGLQLRDEAPVAEGEPERQLASSTL
jgi:hypothetical protein